MTRDQLVDDIARMLALYPVTAACSSPDKVGARAREEAERIVKKVLAWVASSDTEAFGTPNAAPPSDPSK